MDNHIIILLRVSDGGQDDINIGVIVRIVPKKG